MLYIVLSTLYILTLNSVNNTMKLIILFPFLQMRIHTERGEENGSRSQSQLAVNMNCLDSTASALNHHEIELLATECS